MRNIFMVFFAGMLWLVLSAVAFAQKPPAKLGDIPMEELQMASYAADPGAGAVVLFDWGLEDLAYSPATSSFQVFMTRQCRIKVFKNSGFDLATTEILLYKSNNLKESVTLLKGSTYNLENGKVVESKLEKGSIFEEDVNDRIKKVKFTMPNVREGSVIEFTYKLTSDYLVQLQDWKFQWGVPVKWSELYVKIPEYFQYLTLNSGYEAFKKYESYPETKNVTESGIDRSMQGRTVTGQMYTNQSQYQTVVHHWIAENMPALKNEDYVSHASNFRQGVEFQLASTRSGNGQFTDHLGDWPSINKKLLVEVEDFGPNMGAKSFYKAELESILAKYTEPGERIAAIHTFVGSYLKWDGRHRYIPSQNIKKTWDERLGSSADLNAVLISMLRSAGIDADPVLLSTRDNGLVHPVYPILSKFNYLVALARNGDKTVLLDATAPNLPCGVLPVRCLNQQGRIISEKNGDWISLEPAKGHEMMSMSALEFNAGGGLGGTIDKTWDGYGALEKTEELKDAGEEKYLAELRNEHTFWTVTDVRLQRPATVGAPFKESIDLEINDVTLGDELVYLNPMMINRLQENPFKEEKRVLPVDFGYPSKSYQMLTLKIPEGYAVEALPQAVTYSTPDGSAFFKYIAMQSGDKIQFSCNMQVKKSLYLPEEYPSLRQFFALIAAKENEQIVFRKLPQN
jgi:hypothetical protein